ncbi:MAG: hypothetical protein ABSH05_18320 [Bryobacteraceae bacterium]|jgi:hypothetical protein
MRAGFRKRFGQLIFFVALMACALFLSAGRLDWIMAWALLGCYIAGTLVGAVVMLARSPDLIAERAEFKAGAKAWDRHLAAALGLYGPLATWWRRVGRTATCGILATSGCSGSAWPRR